MAPSLFIYVEGDHGQCKLQTAKPPCGYACDPLHRRSTLSPTPSWSIRITNLAYCLGRNHGNHERKITISRKRPVWTVKNSRNNRSTKPLKPTTCKAQSAVLLSPRLGNRIVKPMPGIIERRQFFFGRIGNDSKSSS